MCLFLPFTASLHDIVSTSPPPHTHTLICTHHMEKMGEARQSELAQEGEEESLKS